MHFYWKKLNDLHNEKNISKRIKFLIQECKELKENNYIIRNTNIKSSNIYFE